MHAFPWEGEIERILRVEWWWVEMQTGEISLEGRTKGKEYRERKLEL